MIKIEIHINFNENKKSAIDGILKIADLIIKIITLFITLL